MLNLSKVQKIAESYFSQELFAALVWQRKFNDFDGEKVVTDLSKNPNLWKSFLFTRPIFPLDKDGINFIGMVDILVSMASCHSVSIENIRSFAAYPADTILVLAENKDTIVTQLMDFGKTWKADSVEIIDSNNKECFMLEYRLKRALLSYEKNSRRDAVIVSYWWD